MKNVALAVLFFRLRDMLAKYEPFMRVVKDEEGYYRLYTPTRRPFIGICVQRKHIGIYVMPIFEDSTLIGKLAEKQIGKGTFGFSRDDDPLLLEVPAFMERCFQHCIDSNQVPME
ncbi:MAG: hypothetical protein HOE76_04215 [Euryarchaeota archaeon]|nr:hypothetical protein [Euryarchaeota archaeon]MBT4982966.1 hypothetical protein [Euryarchaeota archaeon]MBT5183586.1 hypothetical protein [Euryarchaeota archaeon]